MVIASSSICKDGSYNLMQKKMSGIALKSIRSRVLISIDYYRMIAVYNTYREYSYVSTFSVEVNFENILLKIEYFRICGFLTRIELIYHVSIRHKFFLK